MTVGAGLCEEGLFASVGIALVVRERQEVEEGDQVGELRGGEARPAEAARLHGVAHHRSVIPHLAGDGLGRAMEFGLGQVGAASAGCIAAMTQGAAALSEQLAAAIRAARGRMIQAFAATLQGFDAMILPTVPIVAPPLTAFEADDAYVRLNLLLLRNPSLINFLDGCAISVPIHDPGDPPVGLMLAAAGGSDRQLFRVAASVEAALQRAPVR